MTGTWRPAVTMGACERRRGAAPRAIEGLRGTPLSHRDTGRTSSPKVHALKREDGRLKSSERYWAAPSLTHAALHYYYYYFFC